VSSLFKVVTYGQKLSRAHGRVIDNHGFYFLKKPYLFNENLSK
jgi:hypothetical protein